MVGSKVAALGLAMCITMIFIPLQDWCNLISAVSDQKLKQALMSQDPQSGVLRVNFDPALVRLLREVRYFLLLPDLPIEIPANALKVNVNSVKDVANSDALVASNLQLLSTCSKGFTQHPLAVVSCCIQFLQSRH